MEGFFEIPPSFLVGSLEALFGLILFPAIFHGCVRLSCLFLRDTSLPPGDTLDICNKIVSSFFAVLSVSVGLSVLRSCGTSVMSELHPLVRHYMCFGLSYFLYDIYSMYLVFKASYREDDNTPTSASAAEAEAEAEGGKQQMDTSLQSPNNALTAPDQPTVQDSLPLVIKFCRARKIMVVHHILIPFFGFPIFMSYRQSLGDCLIALGFCMEASTPFVSLRAILHHLGRKSSLPYLVNGLLMNVVFFICRILVFPYMYHLYAKQCGLSLVSLLASGKVPLFCNSSMLLLFLPQLYWFSLMLRGSVKVIKRTLSGKEGTPKKEQGDVEEEQKKVN